MVFDEFEMEKSVKLAADVLDEMYPRWEEAIKPERLVMWDAELCVLGQMAQEMNNEYTYPSEEKQYGDLWREVDIKTGGDPEIMVAFDLEQTEEAALSPTTETGGRR